MKKSAKKIVKSKSAKVITKSPPKKAIRAVKPVGASLKNVGAAVAKLTAPFTPNRVTADAF